MLLRFRQGIVRHQADIAHTATFIKKNGSDGSFIDLDCDNGPVQFTIAHFEADYLFEETTSVPRAWGPCPTGSTQYLYWDVSLLNGALTRSWTSYPPYTSPTPPSNPSNDQHWFDTTAKAMKVWNGAKWMVKLRVFAGVYDSNSILTAKQNGTQCGISSAEIKAGNIILGKNGYPLRDYDGTYVTTESNLVVANGSSEDVKFDAAIQYAQAQAFLPSFSLVSYFAPNIVNLASYQNTSKQVNGIIRHDSWPGQIVKVVSHGVVANDQWDWNPTDVGKPLFCGANGEITLTPPAVGISQIVGYVYDVSAVYMSILTPTLL
jgi:hypothetical protein